MDQKKGHPPKLAQRLLLSFLREDLSDEVLGDLEEKYYQNTKDNITLSGKAQLLVSSNQLFTTLCNKKIKIITVKQHRYVSKLF